LAPLMVEGLVVSMCAHGRVEWTKMGGSVVETYIEWPIRIGLFRLCSSMKFSTSSAIKA
jgi:hypothetical protein